MRVLAVTNMWPRADRPAFGSFVRSQVESLRELGLEIDVHVISGDRNTSAYVTDVPTVRRAVRRFRPDLVHAHYGLSGWTAAWQRAPLVVSFCGDDLLGTPARGGGITARSRIAVRMGQWAATRAAAIVCKSPNLVAALAREVDRLRAAVIPNGVDTTLFRPGDRLESRRRVGLPPDEEIVLFPHDPAQALQKRFDLAEAAVRELSRRRSGVRLLHVTGVPHARMPEYYRAANCMLLTSDSEGSPNVVKEALMSGVPVVSVDVGDVRSWLERVEGCSIAPRDPRKLADALAATLDRDQRVDPSPVLPDLDRRTVAARLAAVYESVLGASA